MARSPAKLCTAAVQMVMMPQLIMMRPIQTEGEKYFMAKLLGASKMTYGTKNTATAILYRFPVKSSVLTMLSSGVSLFNVRALPRFTYVCCQLRSSWRDQAMDVLCRDN